MMGESSPQLPAAALYPGAALSVLLLVYALTRTRHLTGRFLIFIIWLRYMMQVFHDMTHPPLFAGVSLNALASLGVCVIGALIVSRRLRVIARFPAALPLLLTVIVVSGLMNGLYAGMAETLLKWGYFFVVALCLYDCIRRDGDTRILTALLWVFVPPLMLQAVSIALGAAKASEGDGSVSFIGGFSHEAALSIVLVTCFAVASFSPRLHPGVRVGLLTACVIGIFAANYRTSLIALAPLAVGYFTFSTARAFTTKQRLFIGIISLLGVLALTLGAVWLLRERMTDIAVAASGESLFKPPAEFTEADRDLFSGRFYLWSRYIEGYLAGDDLRILFGFGPDAWTNVFHLYAHNTVISYLYEFGLFGAALIILVWASMLARASIIPDPWLRGQLMFAHIGFIILNFATMPHWLIEGLIFYGLLCGLTIALTNPRRAPTAWARMPVAVQPYTRDRRAPGEL